MSFHKIIMSACQVTILVSFQVATFIKISVNKLTSLLMAKHVFKYCMYIVRPSIQAYYIPNSELSSIEDEDQISHTVTSF